MSDISIKSVISEIETKIKSSLLVYPKKKIIFRGKTNESQSIVVITPESSLNTGGERFS